MSGISCLLFIASSSIYLWLFVEPPGPRQRSSKSSSQKDDDNDDNDNDDDDSSSDSPIVSWKDAQVLLPGLVYFPQAIPMETQTKIVTDILEHGHKSRKMWKQQDHNLNCWELNNLRQGRGRIYDAVDTYSGGSQYLTTLCDLFVTRARQMDPTMPPMTPTHLLTMYYTTTRKLGWHADDGPQDGSSLEPVVSLSFGNDCLFLLQPKQRQQQKSKSKSKSPPKMIRVRIQSGDVILFGGPSRWISHTVDKIYPGTAPKELCDIHQRVAKLHAPFPSISRPGQTAPTSTTECWIPPHDCFRLNLTFRNAPELIGKEEDDKFFYFARSARKFLAACDEDGVDAARRNVVDGRQKKAEEKKRKKEARLLLAKAI